ncbi:MAG: hypothetical protein LGR52_13460, partial [Candidatus Thiosymbion ectosymbiont of Robbea hypermnestra]|nr:hypothetical protein [Candidatus Thiosymbion ectosymbiont of Robbea hypermnestra]
VDMQGLIEGWGEVAPTGAMNPNGFGLTGQFVGVASPPQPMGWFPFRLAVVDFQLIRPPVATKPALLAI